MDSRAEVRDFLTTRRARITPDCTALPAVGGQRRVAGLRREEVALLDGVSASSGARPASSTGTAHPRPRP
ncbi:hypothetical protein [Dactylosporangium sp. CA-139066]|uniref:hypothetical protein n=1 Tax=Dactylosporangium sp. CA-139066 TaxID=3239930 RepID=UPI003D914F63